MLAGVLWAFTGFVFQQLAQLGFTRMGAVGIRMFLACIGMFVVCLVRYKTFPKLCFRSLLFCFGAGVFGFAMFNFFYFETITLTSLSMAAAFLYTSPAFVILLSRIFYKEVFTKPKLLALLATLLGSILITGAMSAQGSLSWAGLAMGLLTGFGYALYNLFSKAPLATHSPEVVTFYTLLFATVASFLLEPPMQSFTLLNTAYAWGLALCLGLLCCMLPSLLFSKGLSQIPPGRASILVASELVVATWLGILQGDSFGIAQILGFVLLLSAIVMVNWPQKKQEKKENS